jgi:hypothetical protein
MKNDILIASLMVFGSIAWLVGLIVLIGRAIREEPRKVKTPEPAPVLRPASGW